MVLLQYCLPHHLKINISVHGVEFTQFLQKQQVGFTQLSNGTCCLFTRIIATQKLPFSRVHGVSNAYK
jgi:hypothetical protein